MSGIEEPIDARTKSETTLENEDLDMFGAVCGGDDVVWWSRPKVEEGV